MAVKHQSWDSYPATRLFDVRLTPEERACARCGRIRKARRLPKVYICGDCKMTDKWFVKRQDDPSLPLPEEVFEDESTGDGQS